MTKEIPRPEDRDYLLSPEIEDRLAKQRVAPRISKVGLFPDTEQLKKDLQKLKDEGYVEFPIEEIRKAYEHRPKDLEIIEHYSANGFTAYYDPNSLSKYPVMYKIVE